MSKLARACAVVVAVATSLAGGIAAAQIQSGVARKAAPPSVALGVPVANPNAKASGSQRSSSNATAGSGSSLNFTSGQPALRYLPDDLPTAKDPVRREAVKDGAKDAGASARGAAPAGNTSEFAPAPGVLRANMPPVSFADAERILKARVLPANLNQGVTATPKTSKTSTSTSTLTANAGQFARTGLLMGLESDPAYPQRSTDGSSLTIQQFKQQRRFRRRGRQPGNDILRSGERPPKAGRLRPAWTPAVRQSPPPALPLPARPHRAAMRAVQRFPPAAPALPGVRPASTERRARRGHRHNQVKDRSNG